MNPASSNDSSHLTLLLRSYASLRLIVVFTLMLSAFLIQITFDVSLPLNVVYYLVAFACSLSVGTLVALERMPTEANAGLQMAGRAGHRTGDGAHHAGGAWQHGVRPLDHGHFDLRAGHVP